MYDYHAYNLLIRSDISLPELAAGTSGLAAGNAPDVVVRIGTIDFPRDPPGALGFAVSGSPEDACFYWEELGAYRVTAGRTITIDPTPGADTQALRLPLLGMVIGMLLRQRGLFVLHSSAVAMKGGAALFIGNRGYGKSTIAAALHARGHDLLSDDWVAIQWNAGVPYVLPAFPRLKLWPDSAASLGNDLDDLPRLATHIEKRNVAATSRFSSKAVPLRCIYVLGRAAVPHIHVLPPQQVILELVRNSLLAFVGREMLPAGGADDLRQSGELLKQVPVHGLQRSLSFEFLEITTALVSRHFCDLPVFGKNLKA